MTGALFTYTPEYPARHLPSASVIEVKYSRASLVFLFPTSCHTDLFRSTSFHITVSNRLYKLLFVVLERYPVCSVVTNRFVHPLNSMQLLCAEPGTGRDIVRLA